MSTHILTKADKYLIVILMIVSLTGIIVNMLYLSTQAKAVLAEIYADGKLIKTMRLKSDYYEEFRIGNSIEYAIVEAKDGKIRIREDDSPRKIGVQTGWISKAPQQIVCLPYRIVIKLTSPQQTDIDVIAH